MTSNNIKYKLHVQICDTTMREFYMNHRFAHFGDSGLDIFCSEDVVIPANSLGIKIRTGIRAEMVLKHDNIFKETSVSYYLLPRSSTVKSPIRASVPVNVIDSEYRGELYFFVDNLSNESIKINRGTKLFQIVTPTLELFYFVIINRLSYGSRGLNGLGSSGLESSGSESK
jgi:dUTPase